MGVARRENVRSYIMHLLLLCPTLPLSGQGWGGGLSVSNGHTIHIHMYVYVYVWYAHFRGPDNQGGGNQGVRIIEGARVPDNQGRGPDNQGVKGAGVRIIKGADNR